MLDVSGLGRLLGDAHAIGEALAAAAGDRGPDIRVAVAPTQIAARLMAIVHPRLTVVADDAAPLSPLPIRALRVLLDDGASCGEAGATARRAKATAGRLETLHRWGLTTLGELAALPSDALSERMGQEGRCAAAARARRRRGAARARPGNAALCPVDGARMADRCARAAVVRAGAAAGAAGGGARTRRSRRGGAQARSPPCRSDDFTRVLQLPAPMRDPKVLRTLLLLDLESHPPAAGIDVVTIELDPAPARIIQYSLLERALPSVETLATLTARLRALVGDRRCGSPSLLETHRPDAFEMRPFAPESRASRASRAACSSA